MAATAAGGEKIIGGKYRLENSIGEGGMATVWLARHVALNRRVAIKFIHLSGPRERVRERFLREARVAASVHHRNVVDILDFGTTDDGDPYMVMEHLEGVTLADRIIDGPPLRFDETVRIMARTLAGLAAVHQAGIVHRDIKPANIFLVEDADGIFPKLLDFGVSRAVGDAEVESVLPSKENVLTGTPRYMSPEQARARVDIDHRTDIYSMGAVLYEAIAGVPAFDAEGVGDIIVKILAGEVTPLHEIRPDVGANMSAVVAQALAIDRNARFQTARQMRDAMLQAVADTAGSLSGDQKSIGGRVGDSLFPVSKPEELIRAVGDALDPGESAVIPSSIPPRDARVSHAPTLDAESPPRRWPWAIVAVLLLAAFGWIALGVPGIVQPTWLREARSAIGITLPDVASTPTEVSVEPAAAEEPAEPAVTSTEPSAAIPESETETDGETETEAETETAMTSVAETPTSETRTVSKAERRRARRRARAQRDQAMGMLFTNPGF